MQVRLRIRPKGRGHGKLIMTPISKYSHKLQIQCDCCDTWQHRHCYALCDQNLASTHVCYRCLLGDMEAPLLAKLGCFSRMRRICWVIRYQGHPKSESAFAKKLGIAATVFWGVQTLNTVGHNKKELSAMLRDLKSEGIVVASARNSKSNIKLQINDEETAANFERHGFLHPLALIQHHVRILECCRTWT